MGLKELRPASTAENADCVNFRSSSPLRRRKVGPRFLGRKPAPTPNVPKATPGAVSAFGQREQRCAARVSDAKVTPERRLCGERGGERLIEGHVGIQGAASRSSDWGPPSLYFSSGVSGLNDVGAFRPPDAKLGSFGCRKRHFRSWQVRTGFNFARRERNQIGGRRRSPHLWLLRVRRPVSSTGRISFSACPPTALLATKPADRYLRSNDWAAFLLTEWRPSAGYGICADASL